MPNFFAKINENNVVLLSKADQMHIKSSLRMKEGDEITIIDISNNRLKHTCKIINNGNSVSAVVCKSEQNNYEPKLEVTLYMSIPKAEKLEFIIQKSIELGVHKIVVFPANRSVSRPDTSKKTIRWQKIAEEAAKQCGRGIIPQIMPCKSLNDALLLSTEDLKFILYEEEHDFSIKQMLNVKTPNSIGFFTGPEGGFEKSEIEAANSSGIRSVSLGNRILRCETVPITALSIIMYSFNEMG